MARSYMQQVRAPEPIQPVLSPHPGDCPKHPLNIAAYCDPCRRERELEHRAHQLLRERLSERSRRIEDGLRAYDSAIKRDQVAIEQRYAAHYLESIQLKTWNEAAEPYTDRVGAEVDAAMLAEALAELRQSEKEN